MRCFILLDITLHLRYVDRDEHFQIASELKKISKEVSHFLSLNFLSARVLNQS